MNMTLENRLISLMAEFCLLDSTTLSRATLTDDIGLDSLSLTQIITAVETEFAFDLWEEDLTNLLDARSIGDFADVCNVALQRSRNTALQASTPGN
jgi:acyl carrier protein